ncbi:MAG: DUF2971 domain-containing protein [Desulfobaccales bacterium]|jgi:hypothetical protein
MTKEKQIVAIYNVPHLYRYRSMKDKELEGVFKNLELYMANPTMFNDPFECRPNIIIHDGRLSKELYIKQSAKRAKLKHNLTKHQENNLVREYRLILNDIHRMEEIYETFVVETGIYCLSAINNNILMWSHYSEGHRGLCLEFDTRNNINLFDVALKVSYSERYPSIDILKMGYEDEYRKAFLTKSKHWEYEQEWRILKPDSLGGPGKHFFPPELLTGVIFGALITDDDKNKVLDWVKNYPTKLNLYQAKISREKYQLDIEPI